MSLQLKKDYGELVLDEDMKFCRALLSRLSKSISEVSLRFYKHYPNLSQGQLLKEIKDPLNQDVRLKDILNGNEYAHIIIEFDFKLHSNNVEYSAFIRRNNIRLSKIYGDFEFDIFGYGNISNLGDLIKSGDKEILRIIQDWIKKDAKVMKIGVREAYIASSEGSPEFDVSKRIWSYYANPVDFLRDVIKFIKYFEEIDAPRYVKEEYLEINDRLKPYNDWFIAKELYDAKGFKSKFSEFVKENNIAVASGSLILSSNDLDKNFVFIREISEKIIFPVMKSVPGRKDFIEIIKKQLK